MGNEVPVVSGVKKKKTSSSQNTRAVKHGGGGGGGGVMLSGCSTALGRGRHDFSSGLCNETIILNTHTKTSP